MAERRHVESKADFFTRLIFDLEGAVVVTALLVMLGTSLWYLLNNDLPKSNEIIISMIIGMIVSKVVTVEASRVGSKRKPIIRLLIPRRQLRLHFPQPLIQARK
jgi:hypothetical protein